jgi:uncharacterized protein
MTLMEVDGNSLEVLGREECLDLLASVPVGRVGISVDALPVVLPVNFCFDRPNERLVIRTAAGTKLRAAFGGAVVAFEVDQFDPMGHSGWSVLVRGRSEVLTDPSELRSTARFPLRPWGDEESDHWVTIAVEMLSGRRVRGWYHVGDHHGLLGHRSR